MSFRVCADQCPTSPHVERCNLPPGHAGDHNRRGHTWPAHDADADCFPQLRAADADR